MPARCSRADQAAPGRVKNRRLSRREHGGHGHVHVRVVAHVTQLAFGLDDVPLKRRTAFGVLVARDEAGAKQRVELGLRAARADQHRPALVGPFVLVAAGHAEPRQEALKGQGLRDERDQRHAEHDRDEPIAVRNVLGQTEHGRHREGALHVAEDHHVLPSPGHALAGREIQEAETAVDRHRASHVQRDHGQRDEPGLAQQKIRSELHADEQKQPDVDDERGDFPEALERQDARRLEPLAHLVADQHARHDDRDDRRPAEMLRQERRREHRDDRGQDGRQFIGRASAERSRRACRKPCPGALRRRWR